MQYAVEHYPGAVTSQSFAVTEQSFQSAAQGCGASLWPAFLAKLRKIAVCRVSHLGRCLTSNPGYNPFDCYVFSEEAP